MIATPPPPTPLIAALLSPAAYPHPAQRVRLIETHISWVLLAGEFAYKIKKPLNLGFLDFSTLARRRFCCEEEVRLNRRLAPDTYLDVAAVVGGAETARIWIGDPDKAMDVQEWAVRMRAFPADATLDREAKIGVEQIDAIADRIARFHGEIVTAPSDGKFGDPEAVIEPIRENIAQIRALSTAATYSASLATLPSLDRIATWSEAEFVRLAGFIAGRKRDGFIRECHGDLHLGNIAWVDGAPLVFDCIEFNPRLRFIDVISEAAFLCMDLTGRGHDDLAWRFLNRYLDHTGDHLGLTGFRFYRVYRAMVRAKVAAIRAGQGDAGAGEDVLAHLELAIRLGERPPPFLLLMHGLSGSGKSWLSQRLLERLGAIRLRSDVERKRLFGLPALADSGAAIYGLEATRRTFAHLAGLAGTLLDEGFPVIVDATFLYGALRGPFLELAGRVGCPWRIVSLRADPETLRERVAARQARRDDPSEAGLAVLEAQMRDQEALSEEESAFTLTFDYAERDAWPERMEGLAEELSA